MFWWLFGGIPPFHSSRPWKQLSFIHLGMFAKETQCLFRSSTPSELNRHTYRLTGTCCVYWPEGCYTKLWLSCFLCALHLAGMWSWASWWLQWLLSCLLLCTCFWPYVGAIWTCIICIGLHLRVFRGQGLINLLQVSSLLMQSGFFLGCLWNSCLSIRNEPAIVWILHSKFSWRTLLVQRKAAVFVAIAIVMWQDYWHFVCDLFYHRDGITDHSVSMWNTSFRLADITGRAKRGEYHRRWRFCTEAQRYRTLVTRYIKKTHI